MPERGATKSIGGLRPVRSASKCRRRPNGISITPRSRMLTRLPSITIWLIPMRGPGGKSFCDARPPICEGDPRVGLVPLLQGTSHVEGLPYRAILNPPAVDRILAARFRSPGICSPRSDSPASHHTLIAERRKCPVRPQAADNPCPKRPCWEAARFPERSGRRATASIQSTRSRPSAPPRAAIPLDRDRSR